MRAEGSATGPHAPRMTVPAHSFLACLLLVVMAVQGITPDHNDLASSRVLELLLRGMDPSVTGEDIGNRAGEVCDRFLPGSETARRCLARPAHEVDSITRVPIIGETPSKYPSVPGPHRAATGYVPLIHLLCHLTC